MNEQETMKFQEPDMVYVPEGEFMMGDDDNSYNPLHKVYLDHYYIGKYTVTNQEYGEYIKVMGCEKPKFWDDPSFNGPRQPVVGVSWNDAVAYCEWLSKMTGKNFRLPTEAEWEKAARGTDGRKYPWGDEEPDRTMANYGPDEPDIRTPNPNRIIMHTINVGDYPRNKSPYGAMDMAGNIWEMCSDWHDDEYCVKSPNRNPRGPESGESIVIRGGCCFDYPHHMRASDRFYTGTPPYGRGKSLGFRCAMTP
jgi:formylglycine-generating enzyme required for sulfatase activity